MIKFLQLWEMLRTSLWFVPAQILLVSILLAVGLIEADTLISSHLSKNWPLLFGVGAEGSRGMLVAIASSMMTVAGVTFSITIVALSLTSSQYTPRILRNFMRDRANQTVLGMFIGIFTYCLIVLRVIRGGDEGGFVPSLAVFFGFLLALTGVGVLIFFIHHIISRIQDSNIISSVASETLDAIDKLFPDTLGDGEIEENDEEWSTQLNEPQWQPIPSANTGYIQNLDEAELLLIAIEHNTVLRMECGIGEFVISGMPIIRMNAEKEPSEELIKSLNGIYAIGSYRTVDQDIGFGIRQLVDISLKALSPGINDTTTAVMCVDYLAAIMTKLVTRRIFSLYRYEEEVLRVVVRGPTFEKFLTTAFDQIRRDSKDNVTMIISLLGALKIIAGETRNSQRLALIRQKVDAIYEQADRYIQSPYDRSLIEKERFETISLLNEAGCDLV